MARRLSLPIDASPKPAQGEVPTVDAVRRRLGGTGQSEAHAGRVVRFVEDPGAGRLGVVLFQKGEELDIYLGEGWVRRTTLSAIAEIETSRIESLRDIASEVRVFVALEQGSKVRYEDARGQLQSGMLLEKCRYGALVESDDKKLIGVGFRKLWPCPDADVS